MVKKNLLAEFESRIGEFEKYQDYIAKAKDQLGKFSQSVVEKVIRDNEQRSTEMIAEIMPLMTDIEARIRDLDGEIQEICDGRSEAEGALEELELRKVIGDLGGEEFDESAKDHKKALKRTDSKLKSLRDNQDKFRTLLERWKDLGSEAGVLREGPPELDVAEQVVVIDEDEDPSMGMEGPSSGIEPLESEVDSSPEVMVDFSDDLPSLEESVHFSDSDLLGDEGPGMFDESSHSESSLAAESRAVLLYQEGTAHEEAYDLGRPETRVGRGRDNEVRVKNDSKVSRYHCAFILRGSDYFLKDHGSSNGTQVNGELIQERQLLGGEELTIGETIYRFRLLD